MITIVGAGMAGLLAGNMLSWHVPAIVEAKDYLPNNHAAVLRFRTSQISDILGIPFRKVTMVKGTVPWRNPVADMLAYSRKNTGTSRSDRSASLEFGTYERFIAPEDFIQRMANQFGKIYLGQICTFEGPGPYISTIPMPNLMQALGYPKRNDVNFQYSKGAVITGTIHSCDAYVTLQVPDPSFVFSRVSITGDRLIIEIPRLSSEEVIFGGPDILVYQAYHLLGLTPDVDGLPEDTEITDAPYAKILPIPEEERKAFLFWATDKHNIYSLGRFATWRPGLLLDDLVKDIRLIDRWIGSKYEVARHR